MWLSERSERKPRSEELKRAKRAKWVKRAKRTNPLVYIVSNSVPKFVYVADSGFSITSTQYSCNNYSTMEALNYLINLIPVSWLHQYMAASWTGQYPMATSRTGTTVSHRVHRAGREDHYKLVLITLIFCLGFPFGTCMCIESLQRSSLRSKNVPM